MDNIFLKLLIIATAHVSLMYSKSRWVWPAIMVPCIIALAIGGMSPSLITLLSFMCIVVCIIAFVRWSKDDSVDRKNLRWGIPALSLAVIIIVAYAIFKFPPNNGMAVFNSLGVAGFIIGLAQLGFKRVIGWIGLVMSNVFFIISALFESGHDEIMPQDIVCVFLYGAFMLVGLFGFSGWLPAYYKERLKQTNV